VGNQYISYDFLRSISGIGDENYCSVDLFVSSTPQNKKVGEEFSHGTIERRVLVIDSWFADHKDMVIRPRFRIYGGICCVYDYVLGSDVSKAVNINRQTSLYSVEITSSAHRQSGLIDYLLCLVLWLAKLCILLPWRPPSFHGRHGASLPASPHTSISQHQHQMLSEDCCTVGAPWQPPSTI
jgi:hypothetical protein